MKINNPIQPFKGNKAMFPWSSNILDLRPDEYFDDRTRISHSMARVGYRSPEELSLQLAGWKKGTDTAATFNGKAFHMALLEPDRYNQVYLVLDDTATINAIGGASPRSTNRYKEYIAAVRGEADRTGKTIISLEQHNINQAMVDKVMGIPVLKELLDNSITELVVEGTTRNGQIPTRGMIDCTDGLTYVLDVKKVHIGHNLMGFSYEELNRYIDEMDYDGQLFHYGQLLNIQQRYILFVMDEYPYSTALVLLAPSTILRGQAKHERFIAHLAQNFHLATMTLRTTPFTVQLSV